MVKVNKNESKAQAKSADHKAEKHEQKEKLPKAKSLASALGRALKRMQKPVSYLLKHEEVPGVAEIVAALKQMDSAALEAHRLLTALPDDAFKKSSKAPKGAKAEVAVGATVHLTEKAQANWTGLLSEEEVKGSFEVVAVVDKKVRVKTAGGAVLFFPRSNLRAEAAAQPQA